MCAICKRRQRALSRLGLGRVLGYTLDMTDYDLEPLRTLGQQRTHLRAELARVNAEIAAKVPKALKAGRTQADIVRATEMTRESIAALARPPANRWRRNKA